MLKYNAVINQEISTNDLIVKEICPVIKINLRDFNKMKLFYKTLNKKIDFTSFLNASLKKKMNFKELSMGMSADYLDAIKYNSTFLRIGSDIFGSRN